MRSHKAKRVYKFLLVGINLAILLLAAGWGITSFYNPSSSDYKIPTLEEIALRQKSAERGLDLLEEASPDTYAFYLKYAEAVRDVDYRDESTFISSNISTSITTNTDSGEYTNIIEERNKFKVSTKDAFNFWFQEDEQQTDKLIMQLSTAIHESYHAYTIQLRKKQDKHTYYFLSGEEVMLSNRKVFPGSEIKALIPDELRDNRFFYLDKNPELGIFYLINEWHAYYYGLKTAFDLRRVYTQYHKNAWISYLRDFQALMTAHYTFKLFMLQYLDYAAGEHPEVYESLVSDQDFLPLLGKIDQDYQSLFEAFYDFRQELMDKAQEQGYEMRLVEDQMIFDFSQVEKYKAKNGYDSVVHTITSNPILDIKTLQDKYEQEYLKFSITGGSFFPM